jgi:flagellar biosynthesis protein FlhA
MKKKSFYPAGEPEPAAEAEAVPRGSPSEAAAAASIVDSCVHFSDVIVSGKGHAAALKYDEENMFAPMIVILAKDASADDLIRAAENMGVPVIKNIMLAKNLVSYGKTGKSIPESAYQDVSLVFMRIGSRKPGRLPEVQKTRKAIPVKVPRPLSLELGASLFALTGEGPGREALLVKPLNTIRKKLIRLLGFSIPLFQVSRGLKLKNDEYRIHFKGLEAGRSRVELGWYQAADSAAIPTAYFPDIMASPENLRAAAKAASSVLVRHANEVIQRRAPELLGRDEVEAILDAAEEKYPVVTGEVKSLLPLGIIREILQGIVSEQVSISHIAVIRETLADWGSFGPAPCDMIIEQIRLSLKRQICLEYADESLTLRVLTLEPEFEKGFADYSPASRTDPNKNNPIADDWVNVISSAARGMEERGFPPVVLCSPMARLPLKEATRRKFPNLAVLSYMEIPPDISVESVGEIRL